MTRLALAACLLFFLAGAATAQTPESAVRTGGGHLVVVTSSPSEGLEVGMPRDSWYAKGIALDQQGRWEESYDAYRQARQELERMLKERPSWERIIRGWLLKAEFQMDQSLRLKYPTYYRYGHPSSSTLYYRAVAKHNKWLGIRALTGRTSRKLQDEILNDYRRALLQSPGYDSARLALAAMLHELGQHAEARREFAQVKDPGRAWLAMELAYYHAAAGETERALDTLQRAIQYNSSNKRAALRSNDFDRIRSNPRFQALVGAP
jgi:tetratricopeptide (TPR) repeat protein